MVCLHDTSLYIINGPNNHSISDHSAQLGNRFFSLQNEETVEKSFFLDNRLKYKYNLAQNIDINKRKNNHLVNVDSLYNEEGYNLKSNVDSVAKIGYNIIYPHSFYLLKLLSTNSSQYNLDYNLSTILGLNDDEEISSVTTINPDIFGISNNSNSKLILLVLGSSRGNIILATCNNKSGAEDLHLLNNDDSFPLKIAILAKISLIKEYKETELNDYPIKCLAAIEDNRIAEGVLFIAAGRQNGIIHLLAIGKNNLKFIPLCDVKGIKDTVDCTCLSFIDASIEEDKNHLKLTAFSAWKTNDVLQLQFLINISLLSNQILHGFIANTKVIFTKRKLWQSNEDIGYVLASETIIIQDENNQHKVLLVKCTNSIVIVQVTPELKILFHIRSSIESFNVSQGDHCSNTMKYNSPIIDCCFIFKTRLKNIGSNQVTHYIYLIVSDNNGGRIALLELITPQNIWNIYYGELSEYNDVKFTNILKIKPSKAFAFDESGCIWICTAVFTKDMSLRLIFRKSSNLRRIHHAPMGINSLDNFNNDFLIMFSSNYVVLLLDLMETNLYKFWYNHFEAVSNNTAKNELINIDLIDVYLFNLIKMGLPMSDTISCHQFIKNEELIFRNDTESIQKANEHFFTSIIQFTQKVLSKFISLENIDNPIIWNNLLKCINKMHGSNLREIFHFLLKKNDIFCKSHISNQFLELNDGIHLHNLFNYTFGLAFQTTSLLVIIDIVSSIYMGDGLSMVNSELYSLFNKITTANTPTEFSVVWIQELTYIYISILEYIKGILGFPIYEETSEIKKFNIKIFSQTDSKTHHCDDVENHYTYIDSLFSVTYDKDNTLFLNNSITNLILSASETVQAIIPDFLCYISWYRKKNVNVLDSIADFIFQLIGKWKHNLIISCKLYYLVWTFPSKKKCWDLNSIRNELMILCSTYNSTLSEFKLLESSLSPKQDFLSLPDIIMKRIPIIIFFSKSFDESFTAKIALLDDQAIINKLSDVLSVYTVDELANKTKINELRCDIFEDDLNDSSNDNYLLIQLMIRIKSNTCIGFPSLILYLYEYNEMLKEGIDLLENALFKSLYEMQSVLSTSSHNESNFSKKYLENIVSRFHIPTLNQIILSITSQDWPVSYKNDDNSADYWWGKLSKPYFDILKNNFIILQPLLSIASEIKNHNDDSTVQTNAKYKINLFLLIKSMQMLLSYEELLDCSLNYSNIFIKNASQQFIDNLQIGHTIEDNYIFPHKNIMKQVFTHQSSNINEITSTKDINNSISLTLNTSQVTSYNNNKNRGSPLYNIIENTKNTSNACSDILSPTASQKKKSSSSEKNKPNIISKGINK